MNKYTVGKATQGLANYILEQGTQDKGVAISYDSRRMSKEFSLQTALILNANGIKTYLFESLRPVPELSFAVRQLGCTAGIMITASHNPPKYNGYKVYWDLLYKAKGKINIWLDGDAFQTVKETYSFLNHGDLNGRIRYIPTNDDDDPSSIYQKYGWKGIANSLSNARKLDNFQLNYQ